MQLYFPGDSVDPVRSAEACGQSSWQSTDTTAPPGPASLCPRCATTAAPPGQGDWKAPGWQENQGEGQQRSFTRVNIFCTSSSCVRERNNLLCSLNILSWEGMRPSLWAISLHQPLKPPEMGICWYAKAWVRVVFFRLFATNSPLTSLFLSIMIILA